MPKQALESLRVLAVFVLVSSGCTSIKVEITGTDESTPAAVITSTHHSVFWDLFSERSPVEPVKSCSSGGLYSVEHKVNYLYNLLSVVTLGAWVPMQVEWRCANIESVTTRRDDDGSLEGDEDGSDDASAARDDDGSLED